MLNASQDPLFAAVEKAVELVIQRGIEVKPMGDGFYLRIASQEVAEGHAANQSAPAGRNW